MCFQLVYGDFEYPLSLPFEAHVEERLFRLVSQGEPPGSVERSRNDLSRRIVDLVTAMLDGEVLPPSIKQLKYAIAIARELSLELPSEVLQYRSAMAVFLGTHAPFYRTRKNYDRGSARVTSA